MESKQGPTEQFRNYSRYSGMAIQMGVIIAGGSYGGVKLDEYLDLSPLFTLICSLTAIALSMYLIIKDLKNINTKDAHKKDH